LAGVELERELGGWSMWMVTSTVVWAASSGISKSLRYSPMEIVAT
jgi:hypothetical protein